jgi:hypothetical protein
MKAGEFYCSKNGYYRLEIMAIAKGYAMIRYKGAFPFVKWVKNLEKMLDDQLYFVKP